MSAYLKQFKFNKTIANNCSIHSC